MGDHDVFESGLGFLGGLGEDDAFACCEAVGFDDDAVVDRVQVLAGCLIVDEVFVAGGGDVVALHEVFGEGLAAFELGGGGAGAEDLDIGSVLLEVVGDTGDEGCFRAGDQEVEVVVFGVLDESGEVVLGDAVAIDTLRHAAVMG